jgi:KRAB domain-containing zinc finger protein
MTTFANCLPKDPKLTTEPKTGDYHQIYYKPVEKLRSLPSSPFYCVQTIPDYPDCYKCEHCEFSTHLRVELRHHSSIHIKSKKSQFNLTTYKCKNCKFETHSCLILFKHVADLCKTNKWYTCDSCQHRTHSKKYLGQHKKNMHTPAEKIKWFECDQCRFKTKWKSSLKGHTLYKHSVQKRYDNWEMSESEKVTRSANSGGKAESEEKYKCEQCTYRTKYLPILTYHKQMRHTPGPVVSCNHCLYKTVSEVSLRAHINKKHGVSSYHCQLCLSRTLRTDSLNRHMRPHCSECDQKAKQTVEIPVQVFTCDQCTYKTEWQGSLKIHKLIQHTDLKLLEQKAEVSDGVNGTV